MENFFVMLLWFSIGDVMILNQKHYETRAACESQFIPMLGTNKRFIKTSPTTGRPVLVQPQQDGVRSIMWICEEVKFSSKETE